MSNLSDLLPTGGGQNAVDFVASGTLGSGVTVALKADGTVEVVSGVTEGVTSPVQFVSNARIDWLSSTYDSSNNKIVISYGDFGNSTYGTSVVGTISSGIISFGTPVVFNSQYTKYTSSVFDSNLNKVVISYQDQAQDILASIVGTVSGTSISFGTEAVATSAFPSGYISSTFDSNLNKVVIAYDNTNDGYGKAIVATVSGTSISYGSPATFRSSEVGYIACTFDSTSNKVVIAYRTAFNGGRGTAIVGTVSGTSISFGTEVTFNPNTTTIKNTGIAFDSVNNRVVIAYRDYGNSSYGTAIVGTVSGTSISFGTSVVFNSATTEFNSVVFDSNANKTVFLYSDDSTYGKFIVGTVSNTSISFGTSTTFQAGRVRWPALAFDSTENKVVGSYNFYTDASNTVGNAVVFTAGSSNNTSFIGITAEAIADTATGPVNVYGGINEAQSGLTIGSDYYVQADGSIATTVSDVKIGQAISATTINIRDLT
jgi:hypothetical protein